MIRRYSVVAGRPYQGSGDERKIAWVRLGSAVMLNDGQIRIKLDAQPIGDWWDGTYSLFEQPETAAAKGAGYMRGGAAGGHRSANDSGWQGKDTLQEDYSGLPAPAPLTL